MRQSRHFLLCDFLFSGLWVLSWCFARMGLSAPGRLALLSRNGGPVSRSPFCAKRFLSLIKIIGQIFEFFELLQFILDSDVRAVNAYFFVLRGHSLKCSCLTCFLFNLRFIPPIHGRAQIDSQNTFPFGRLAPCELSPLQSLKTLSRTWSTR